MYMQARNGGMGEIDWGGILKDAVGGYVAVKGAQTQADILKTQLAQQKAQQDAMIYQLSPQYSPQYGAPVSQQSNLMPILLIGGAALVLFFLMKD